MITVEVAYARPDIQMIRRLEVKEGCTAEEAIRLSGLLEQFPDIDLAVNTVGIFGKAARLDTLLRARDRVEIYRPLQADPKEVRKQRAAEARALRQE